MTQSNLWSVVLLVFGALLTRTTAATGANASALKAGDVVSTRQNEVPFVIGDRTIAILPIGTKVTVTEVRGSWAGGYVTLSGKRYSGGWVPMGKLERGLKAGDVASTTEDEVPFVIGDRTIAVLPVGAQVTVTEVRGSWAGGYVTLHGKKYSGGWVPVDKLERGLTVGDVASTTEDRLHFIIGGRTIAVLPVGTELTVTEVRGPWVGGNVILHGETYSGGWIPMGKLNPTPLPPPKVDFLDVRLNAVSNKDEQPAFEDIVDSTTVGGKATYSTTRTISREITWTVKGVVETGVESQLEAGIIAARADLRLQVKARFELERKATWTDQIVRTATFQIDLRRNPRVRIVWYDVYESGTVDVRMKNRTHKVPFRFPNGTRTVLEDVK